MLRIFINPVLEFVYSGYPGENGYNPFELMFFCTSQIFRIIKEHFPMVHTEELHSHACHLSNFQWVGEKAMNCMTTFMDHGGNITHLACCIHENKRSAGFCQWTVVPSGSLSFPTIQIKAFHFCLL